MFTLHQLDGRVENIADGQWSAFKRIMKGSNVTKKKKRVKNLEDLLFIFIECSRDRKINARIIKTCRHLFIFEIYGFFSPWYFPTLSLLHWPFIRGFIRFLKRLIDWKFKKVWPFQMQHILQLFVDNYELCTNIIP